VVRASAIVGAVVAFAGGCRDPSPPSSASAPVGRGSAPPGYLKGQLHVHSNHSGDSRTAPEDVVRWYRDRGYDFIVFTDHNAITTFDASPDMLVIPGAELTQNLKTCEPPPPAGSACLLHVNALFVTAASGHESGAMWKLPPTSRRRIEIYRNALDAIRDARGLAQLNHPNFQWAADAQLVAQLVEHDGLRLFEVANQSSDVSNDGDADHPSVEAMWDAVLTRGGTLFGVASDDAHHYDDAAAVRAQGGVPDTGDQGWVMVHATRDPSAIRDALARGDFYSSTGVVLRRIERTGDALVVEVADETPGDLEIAFIGAGGRVLDRQRGRSARFALAAARGGYVRATLADARGHRAWLQPTRVE
jgi:hypothetical protein